VINMQSSLEHHLLQVSVAQGIPQVTADTEQNYLSLEVTPFEQATIVHEVGSPPSPEYLQVYRTAIIFATRPSFGIGIWTLTFSFFMGVTHELMFAIAHEKAFFRRVSKVPMSRFFLGQAIRQIDRSK